MSTLSGVTLADPLFFPLPVPTPSVYRTDDIIVIARERSTTVTLVNASNGVAVFSGNVSSDEILRLTRDDTVEIIPGMFIYRIYPKY